MRPLRLKLKGLRSYRTECEIDFEGVGLMAIVGDTGAGKSSLLEAITYALFNGTTWSGTAVKDLISMGEQAMTVQFDFEVDGRQYRVVRSTSKASTEPVHILSSLSQPNDEAAIDKEGPVNARIKELLGGMDREHFLSAALLPQGQFQTLLQARPAERATVLKGIFRLERLDAVHDLAERMQIQYRPYLDNLLERRAELPADPLARARELELVRQEMESKQQRLDALRGSLHLAQEAARQASQRGVALGQLAERVREADQSAARRLEDLLPYQQDLEEQREQLARQQGQARACGLEKDRQIAEAEQRGESLERMLAAQQAAEHLIRELPAVAQERERLGELAKELEMQRKELGRRTGELDEIKRLAQSSVRSRDEAEAKAGELRDQLEQARLKFQEWTAKASGAAEAVAALPGLKAAIDVAREDLETAERTLKGEQAGARERTAELEELQRRNASFHAAHAAKPGEPCPVCQRSLPASFIAPQAVDETEARAALDLVRGRVDQAGRAVAEKKVLCQQAEQAALDRKQAVEETAITAWSLEQELLELLPVGDGGESQETRLHLLAEREQALRQSLQEQRETAEQRRIRAERASAELDSARQRLDDNQKRLGEDRSRLDEREESVGTMRAQIPVSILPKGLLIEASIQMAESKLIERVGALKTLAAERDGELAKVQSIQDAIGTLEIELQRVVGLPRQERRVELASLRQRLVDATSMLEQAPPPEHPGMGCKLIDELAWARLLESCAKGLLIELDVQVEEAHRAAGEQQKAATEALAEAGAESAGAFEQAVIEVGTQAGLGKAAHEAAVDQIPQAADLDDRIREAGGLVAALADLAKLLTDGQFIGYAVAQKQRALLGIASDILGAMTAKRYGFADNFRVVDRQSGQARGTRTLSGGETFLASLALALGLVELAGRSGGRMQALFMDEGFGSLDANSLDEALSELERCANSGRLVALVSHLKAVAERIETVLNITRSPIGSEVRWLKAADRDRLAEQEIEQGLLA